MAAVWQRYSATAPPPSHRVDLPARGRHRALAVLRLEFERPADHLDSERSACVDGAAPVLVAPDKEGASAVAEVQLGDLDARGLDMVYEATLSRVVVRESSVQLVLPLM